MLAVVAPPFAPASHSIGSSFEHLARAPPVVGDHRDRVVELHHLDEAAQAEDALAGDRHQLPAEHRALRDRGVHHAGQLHVDAEERLAHDLVVDVEAATPSAPRRFQSFGSFSFTSFGGSSLEAACATWP